MRQNSSAHAVMMALTAGLGSLAVLTAVFLHKALAYDELVFVNASQESGAPFPLRFVQEVEEKTSDDKASEDKSVDVPVEQPKRAPLETKAERPVHADAPAVATGAPARLLIPSIGVNAAIELVGLTSSGSMDVPKRPANAGWYRLGPRPGERGSATIAGHVDWYNGAHAVFVDLHKVKVGDTITVKNDRDEAVHFVVREMREYEASAAATEVFVSADDGAHLNLITCIGKWDSVAGEYSHRFVVFADRQ